MLCAILKKKILEAATHKTAAIQLLNSYLTKHPNKRNKKCWALLKKHRQTH